MEGIDCGEDEGTGDESEQCWETFEEEEGDHGTTNGGE